jgi:ubiquinone/menaquinone biosynthesis C-methylase UbiE
MLTAKGDDSSLAEVGSPGKDPMGTSYQGTVSELQPAIAKPLGDERTAKFAAYTEERRRYWTKFARTLPRWERSRTGYQQRLVEIYSFLIAPGMRVLEIGCGRGDLIAGLKPSYGVGVDFCRAMLDLGHQRNPGLNFVEADAHTFDLGETFDYIIVADLVNDLWDIQQVMERIARHCHPGTRVILNVYSRLWEVPRRIAEAAGIAKQLLTQNWVVVEDLRNLLYLSNLELIRQTHEILWPFWAPGLKELANRYLVKLTPFRWLAMSNILIARPMAAPVWQEPVVTVVVPARNEEGNIPQIVDRVPQMGAGTELIFVEGNSTDDTWGAIQRELALRPGVRAKAFKQSGKGKGDAVRKGFQEASGDVLMILDADLTVAPEDLPRFYEAWRSGHAEFVNGVRLVYPMEDRAMRFFNHVGNKFFSLAFSWLLGQNIKDSLCGTKVLSRQHYRMIAANRSYFGEIDPFGDFDLLFGAAKYNLKIVDLPVRYQERVWGETNIRRWSHGMLLLRMIVKATKKIKFV